MIKKRVVLIVGHDLKSSGCSNKELGVTEFSQVSEIVSTLMSSYTNKNVDILVKYRNTLSDLPNEVNRLVSGTSVPTIVISLHLNAFNGGQHGEEFLVCSKNGEALAKEFMKTDGMPSYIKQRDLKVVKNGDRGHFILSKVKPVAVLYEPFFLDAVESAEELVTLNKATATKLANMIDVYEKL